MIPINVEWLARFAGVVIFGSVIFGLGVLTGFDISPSADCQKERKALRADSAGAHAEAALGWLVGYATLAQSERGLDAVQEMIRVDGLTFTSEE